MCRINAPTRTQGMISLELFITMTSLTFAVLLALVLAACGREPGAAKVQVPEIKHQDGKGQMMKNNRITKTEEQWRETLSPEQFHVLREKGTERAFTGEYWNNKEKGVYVCAGCGQALFSSEDKFDSGTGWPSYTRPTAEGAIETEKDLSLFMERVEVLCGRCGGHLGHVFNDGPEPTGKRYCINSASLDHVPEDELMDDETKPENKESMVGEESK